MKTILAILLLTGVVTAQPVKLTRKKINDEISVHLPANFLPMTPEDLIQRYPSVRAPLGAFTDPDRLVDFSANISATRWPDGDPAMAKDFFKASILNMYDRVTMINEGITEIHKKKFIFFEFDSRINPDGRNLSTQDALVRYAYIMYLVEPRRTLVFSFGCTKDMRDQWQPVAREVMKTVKVK